MTDGAFPGGAGFAAAGRGWRSRQALCAFLARIPCKSVGMTTLFAALTALVLLAWASALAGTPASGAAAGWVIRQQGIYLSGLLSIAFLSLAMLLASRPVWLEAPLGGMDRVYRAHRWAAILGCAFAALHWLCEQSDDLVKALIGRAGRVARESGSGVFEALRELAEDLGEWAIYLLLAMLLITLWKRFPYRPWRWLHRLLPLIYLGLVFHAVLLAPAAYWTQPVGALLALLLAGGLLGSAQSLTGRIGRSRQVTGEIVALEQRAGGILSVRCRLAQRWPGHRPGQFAFVRFDAGEGQHPFTIACADRGDREIVFEIKGLGDYTRSLPGRLRAGQTVWVEGPYGRFDFTRRKRHAQQIWIAGGIGVTPFLAWLEALHAKSAAPVGADFHYCTGDRATDPFVARLESLCAALPEIRLQVHGASQGERLDAAQLIAGRDRSRLAEIWFCGPQGLADSLQSGLRAARSLSWRFHQEAFALRS